MPLQTGHFMFNCLLLFLERKLRPNNGLFVSSNLLFSNKHVSFISCWGRARGKPNFMPSATMTSSRPVPKVKIKFSATDRTLHEYNSPFSGSKRQDQIRTIFRKRKYFQVFHPDLQQTSVFFKTKRRNQFTYRFTIHMTDTLSVVFHKVCIFYD